MPTRQRHGARTLSPLTRMATAVPVGVDSLESRLLFSAMLEVTRTLVITGTAGADFITVDLDVGLYGARTLRVTENGAVSGTFAEGAVEDMLILCDAGNDFVRIGSGGFSGSVITPAQIEGGPGNDELNGGAGSDTLLGGEGDDFITGYEGNDFVDAGAGDDTVVVHVGNDTVFGGTGNDDINGKETGKSSIMDGGEGDDTITGTSHRDILIGGPGNDRIEGGRGADKIHGDDGNDVITVTGKGKVYGDLGADTFVGKNRKGVKDFTPGIDTLVPVGPNSSAVATTSSISAAATDMLTAGERELLG